MSHDEALRLLNEWKVTGAKLFASGKHADGSGITFPAARVKFTSTSSLTLIQGNNEVEFDLSSASFGKTEGVPDHLLRLLITSISITFPNGGALALCELAR